MTRLSGDEIRHGRVWNGIDYELQVWVVDSIIQDCGHPATMRFQDRPCCNAYRLAGQKILDVPNAQSKDIDNGLTGIYGSSQTPSRETA
jgi:hypothetical protein